MGFLLQPTIAILELFNHLSFGGSTNWATFLAPSSSPLILSRRLEVVLHLRGSMLQTVIAMMTTSTLRIQSDAS